MALEKINLGEYPSGKGGDNQRIASEKFNNAVDALGQEATTTQKGVVQLNNTLTSSSDKHALTAAMGKKLQDEKLAKTDVINKLDSATANIPLSAAMGKKLNDEKLGKKENAASASVLETPRKINGVDFDGSKDIETPVFGATNGLVPARIGSTSNRFLNENGTWSTTPNTNTTYSFMSESTMQAGTSTIGQVVSAERIKQAVEFWGTSVVRTYKDLVVKGNTAYKNNYPHDIWISVFVELVNSGAWARLEIADSPTSVFRTISATANSGFLSGRIECIQAWIPSGKTWRISFSPQSAAIADPIFYTPQEYS